MDLEELGKWQKAIDYVQDAMAIACGAMIDGTVPVGFDYLKLEDAVQVVCGLAQYKVDAVKAMLGLVGRGQHHDPGFCQEEVQGQ